MNRLLAVKLTNLIKKWADSRGLPIECRLKNKKQHGADKVTHCAGEVVLPTEKVELYFDTEWFKYNTLTVRGYFADLPTIRVSPLTIFLKDLDDTLDHILKQLADMSSVTHDGLADLKLTGLPDLAHNPILATYLSDAPNANNNVWSRFRDKISTLLTLQGVDTSMHPNNDYSGDNYVGFQLYELLHHTMCGDNTLGHTYYHALIEYHQPLPSETVSGCITYYQDDRKRQAGIRTPIKIRKYLDKFFRDAFDANKLCVDKEYIVDAVTNLLTLPMDLDVRIYDDSNLDGWAEAYASEKISSCMNTTFKNYGVGTHETFRCYLTSHFTDGAFSSGLSLAVLYSAGSPVARSIVYEQDGQKYYVRNYADDRLVKWFESNGYEHGECIPEGTHLYTCNRDGGSDDEYICPYVDGDSSEGEPNARFERIDGHNLWVIDYNGNYTLQVTCGYMSVSPENACDCCNRRRIEHHDIPNYTDGGTVGLCEVCYDEEVCYIDREWQYCEGIWSSDLVHDNEGDWYSPEYLERTNQVVVDGVLCDRDDCFYCKYIDGWVHENDGVNLDDAPDFIVNSWSGYIDGGYVSKAAYDRYGFELEYYSDYLIHERDITSVLLDGVIIQLADEHISMTVAAVMGKAVVIPHYTLARYDKGLYDHLVTHAENIGTNPKAIYAQVFV